MSTDFLDSIVDFPELDPVTGFPITQGETEKTVVLPKEESDHVAVKPSSPAETTFSKTPSPAVEEAVQYLNANTQEENRRLREQLMQLQQEAEAARRQAQEKENRFVLEVRRLKEEQQRALEEQERRFALQLEGTKPQQEGPSVEQVEELKKANAFLKAAFERQREVVAKYRKDAQERQDKVQSAEATIEGLKRENEELQLEMEKRLGDDRKAAAQWLQEEQARLEQEAQERSDKIARAKELIQEQWELVQRDRQLLKEEQSQWRQQQERQEAEAVLPDDAREAFLRDRQQVEDILRKWSEQFRVPEEPASENLFQKTWEEHGLSEEEKAPAQETPETEPAETKPVEAESTEPAVEEKTQEAPVEQLASVESAAEEEPGEPETPVEIGPSESEESKQEAETVEEVADEPVKAEEAAPSDIQEQTDASEVEGEKELAAEQEIKEEPPVLLFNPSQYLSKEEQAAEAVSAKLFDSLTTPEEPEEEQFFTTPLEPVRDVEVTTEVPVVPVEEAPVVEAPEEPEAEVSEVAQEEKPEEASEEPQEALQETPQEEVQPEASEYEFDFDAAADALAIDALKREEIQCDPWNLTLSESEDLHITNSESVYYLNEENYSYPCFRDVSLSVPTNSVTAVMSDVPFCSYAFLHTFVSRREREGGAYTWQGEPLKEKDVLYIASSRLVPEEGNAFRWFVDTLPGTKEERVQKTRELFEEAGVSGLAEEPLRNLSHAKRMLMLLLLSSCHRAPVVVLNDHQFAVEEEDEETARRVFRRLAESGKTVLAYVNDPITLSMANHVLFFRSGEVAFQGGFDRFLKTVCPAQLSLPKEYREQVEAGLNSDDRFYITMAEDRICLQSRGEKGNLEEAAAFLLRCGVPVEKLRVVQKNANRAFQEVLA